MPQVQVAELEQQVQRVALELLDWLEQLEQLDHLGHLDQLAAVEQVASLVFQVLPEPLVQLVLQASLVQQVQLV